MRVRRPERGVPLFDNADGHREKLRAWGLLQDRVNDTRCRPARRPTDPSRRAVRISRLATAVGRVPPPPRAGALATPLDLVLTRSPGRNGERDRGSGATDGNGKHHPSHRGKFDLHCTHERGARIATARLRACLKFVNIAHIFMRSPRSTPAPSPRSSGSGLPTRTATAGCCNLTRQQRPQQKAADARLNARAV